MTPLITKQFNGTPFVFREDGWFNMTKAAALHGKRPIDFLRLPATLEYIEALCEISTHKEFHFAVRGPGTLPNVGTWAHPKLAVFFARWLDVRFAVWCDAVIGGLGGAALRIDCASRKTGPSKRGLLQCTSQRCFA